MLAEEKAWRHLPRNSQQTMSLYLCHYYFSLQAHFATWRKARYPSSNPSCGAFRNFQLPVCLFLLQAQRQTALSANPLKTLDLQIGRESLL